PLFPFELSSRFSRNHSSAKSGSDGKTAELEAGLAVGVGSPTGTLGRDGNTAMKFGSANATSARCAICRAVPITPDPAGILSMTRFRAIVRTVPRDLKYFVKASLIASSADFTTISFCGTRSAPPKEYTGMLLDPVLNFENRVFAPEGPGRF